MLRKVNRKRVYPVRAKELPWIKKVRLRELRGCIGSGDDLTFSKFELGVVEFIMLVCMYECNMTDLIYYLDLTIDHGAILVHVVYLLLTVILSMPLKMLLLFMSSYSKKSYLRFFSCSPLFEGLGYVIAVVKITTELFNTTLAAMSLLVIYHCIIGRFKSSFCKGLIKRQNGVETCITMHPKTPYNFTCGEKPGLVQLTTATQFYIAQDVTTYIAIDVKKGVPKLHIPLLVSATVIWTVIFLMSVNGVRRIKGVTIFLQVIFGLIMTTIVIITMFHGHSRPPSSDMNSIFSTQSLMSINFWVQMILHTTYPNGFGCWIWLGTLKPKQLDPKFAVILTSQLKLIVFAAVSCMGAIVYQDNLSHHKIFDAECLQVSGFHIILSFVPDVLYRTSIHKLAIPMWYSAICYFSFLSPMFSIMGLVDSFVQRFRPFSKYKLYVCGVICVICYVLNMILVTDLGGYVLNCWRGCGMPILSAAMLLAINMAIFFVYSSKEVVDDYLFTYGIPPEKYWITFWKTSPIFAIFGFIFALYNQYNRKDCHEGDFIAIMSYVECSAMVIPVFVFFAMKCCNHVKYANSESVAKPDGDWGPYNPNKKEERKYFHPQREIKYRSTTLKCKHRCSATYNTSYKIKAHLEDEKFYHLETEFLCFKVKPKRKASVASIDL